MPREPFGPPPPTHHSWLYRRAVLPIFALLRMGSTPRSLAWSIALGLLIGINPIVGSTTVLCLAAASALRLNLAASQIANHLAFPLQLVLVVPFIRLASRVFGLPTLPLAPHSLLLAARTAPVALTRQLWRWESRAFLLWLVISVVAVPLIAFTLTPILRRILHRIQQRQYPILEP